MKSVVNFFKNFTPHLPFRFVVEFFTDGKVNAANMKYTVQLCKAGPITCDTSLAATYYGDGYYTIPIYDPSSRQLDITFEETDEMKVLKFLDAIYERQRFGLPYVIGIGVTQFETHMNEPIHRRLYSCILSNYDEPAFSRTGGVSLVQFNASFIIMSENEWDGGMPKATYGNLMPIESETAMTSQLSNSIEKVKPSPAIDLLADAEEEYNRRALEETVPGSFKGTNHDRDAARRNSYRANNINPVSLTAAQEDKLKRIFEKANASLDRAESNDSFENWKNRFQKEHDNAADIDNILKNTERTIDHTIELKQKMKEQGYDLSLAGTQDTYGALLGQHSETSDHNNGNKADIKIYDKNGNAIDFRTASPEQVQAVQTAIAKTGMVKTAVVEYNSKGNGTGWIDVNYTGDDWRNMDGVAVDGTMYDAGNKGLIRRQTQEQKEMAKQKAISEEAHKMASTRY